MKKMKNGILKTLAAIAGTMFVLSVCAMTDTQSFVPEIVSFISLAYLILFGYANGIFKEPEVPVKNEKGIEEPASPSVFRKDYQESEHTDKRNIAG